MTGFKMRNVWSMALAATIALAGGWLEPVWATDLQNGNFDASTGGWTVAEGWTSYSSATGTFAKDTVNFISTPNAQKITPPTSGQGAYAGVRQTIDAGIGDAVTFVVYALQNSNNTYETARLGARFDGTTTHPTTGWHSVTERQTWTTLRASGIATATSVTVFLDVLRGSAGTYWSVFDGVYVRRAFAPATPVVGNPTTSSLDVDVQPGNNSVNNDGLYAISIGGGDYTLGTHWVQEDGSVATTSVWRRDSHWGTMPVTGLAPDTTYTFQVAACHSSYFPQATGFSPSASGTTSTASSDVVNGGMETFGSAGAATGWTRYWSGQIPWFWSADSSIKYGGTNSQKIRMYDATLPRTDYCGLYQVVAASPGDAITFEARGRTFHNNNTYAGLFMGVQWDGSVTPPTFTGDGQGGDEFFWLTASGRATADKVTLFLQAKRNGNAGVDQLVWFDEAVSHHAYVPPAPTIGNAAATTLDVDVNPGSNSANGTAKFLITISGGTYTAGTHYVQANGSVSTTAAWRTDAQWGTTTVTGLTSSTVYTFKVYARHSDDWPLATDPSPVAEVATLCSIPAAPTNPQAAPASVCVGSLVTLSATVGAGEIVDWYTGDCGGIFKGSGLSFQDTLAAIPATYFAQARNTTTNCVSATCASVTVDDTTPPAITVVGGDQQFDCMTNQGNQYEEQGANWSDSCDGGPFPVTIITYGPNGPPNTQAPDVYTVKYDATDSRGNAATQKTRTVTVAQAQSQLTISNVPADLDIWCQTGSVPKTNETIADWLADPRSSDNCNENSQISNNAPDAFPIGTTAVTWTVTDPDLPNVQVPATRNVNIHGLPAAPTGLQSDPTNICSGAATSLSATVGAGGDTVVWYSDTCGGTQVGAGSPLPVTPQATTSYYAASMDSTHNCIGQCAGPVGVTVKPTPSSPTPSSNSPVCTGQTLNLSANAVDGASYAWTGPNGFRSTLREPTIPNVTTAHAGPYEVKVTVNGCESPAGTTPVTVNLTPATPTVESNSPVCTGQTLNLSTNAVDGASYAWTGPNGFQSTDRQPTIPNVTTAHAGSYEVKLTVSGCESQAGSGTVTVKQTPATPIAESNSPVIAGSVLNLSTSEVANATYSWTGPNGFTSADRAPSISNVSSLNAGQYSVTVTVDECESQQGTTLVVVTGESANDLDLDGVANDVDNCPLQYNPDQADTGGTAGVGDACDVQGSVINYMLELGGNNAYEVYESVITFPAFQRGSPLDGTTHHVGSIITWDVWVSLYGTHWNPGGLGHGMRPNGGACMVFDLELHRDTADGQLVPIGAGTAADAGWFSQINDGDADGTRGITDLRENAAFCSAFSVGGLGLLGGRVIDDWAHGGPAMSVSQYPCANGWPADCSAAPGKLIGMGACSEFFATDSCSPGVGMTPPIGAGCGTLAPRPLFEGQINTAGLSPGTYVLVLKPQGGNILRGDFNCPQQNPPWFAVPANHVFGDTIVFQLVNQQ